MIKADGSAKVKERLRLNSLRYGLGFILFFVLFAAPLTHAEALLLSQASPELSEDDVRKMEEREYGIEEGQSAPTTTPEVSPSPTPSSSESGSEPTLEDHQFEADPEKIRSIEAEDFKVKSTKKSTSGRVWLFEDPTENRPRPGRVLLIKSGEQDIVAVRVLKNYPARFAAKIVLKFKDPQPNAEYRALKKLGDKITALIKEREEQENRAPHEMKTDEELAKEVAPDDNELDRGIPAPAPVAPKKKEKKSDSTKSKKENSVEPLFTKDGFELNTDDMDLGESADESSLDMNEDIMLEPKNHALSLEYASLKSVDKRGDSATYSGLGLRYAYNAFHKLLFKKKSLQDMISPEIGLFYYSITGFVRADDQVTVYPLNITVRYSLLLNDTFSVFGYLGLMKNLVSTGSTESNLTKDERPVFNEGIRYLKQTKTALGAGAMMKIGPSWAVRLEYGLDLFAIGAVLKF
jgi:hypothetical protein